MKEKIMITIESDARVKRRFWCNSCCVLFLFFVFLSKGREVGMWRLKMPNLDESFIQWVEQTWASGRNFDQ